MAVRAFPGPLDKGQPIGVMAPFRHVMALADQRRHLQRSLRILPDAVQDPFWAMGVEAGR